MGMFTPTVDDHGSGVHPVTILEKDGGDRGGMGSYLWAVVIVVVFLVIIFFAFAMMFRGRDGERGMGNAAEIAAISALNTRPYHFDGGTSGGDARAAFTEINGRFDALSQQVSHINDVNDLRDLKSTQAALGLQIAGNRTDTLLNFKDLALQVSQGNCDINRNIDNTRFENAQNTCSIISNADANARAILERMSQDEIARLRDALAVERDARARETLLASQLSQTASIIGAIRPYPVAAYSVFPPIPVEHAG